MFKTHPLPSMWSALAEFYSASSESRWRKKEERKIAVKPKSAEKYVGWLKMLLERCTDHQTG